MQIEINKEYTIADDQFLWRYMDLHRLIYFLNTENIFFSPLSTFFDQEGSAANGSLKVDARQVSLFPILPAVTWNVKF